MLEPHSIDDKHGLTNYAGFQPLHASTDQMNSIHGLATTGSSTENSSFRSLSLSVLHILLAMELQQTQLSGHHFQGTPFRSSHRVHWAENTSITLDVDSVLQDLVFSSPWLAPLQQVVPLYCCLHIHSPCRTSCWRICYKGYLEASGESVCEVFNHFCTAAAYIPKKPELSPISMQFWAEEYKSKS